MSMFRQVLGAILNVGEERPSRPASGAVDDAAAQVDRARAALGAAERDTAEARARLAEREAALSTAEEAFDNEASDEHGAAVLAARNSRDLAKLQHDRAERRELAAREALALAERAAERSRVEAQLEEAERRHQDAVQAERRRRAERIAEHPARAVLEAIRLAEQRERQATAEHEKARAALDASTAELAALEEQVQAVAPDRAEELRARAERRTAAARDELAERAALAAARERIDPSVDLVIAGEALIRKGLADIDAAVEDARDSAKRARELGADVKAIGTFHKLAHVQHAQFLALPEKARHWYNHSRFMGYTCGAETQVGMGGNPVKPSYRFELNVPSSGGGDATDTRDASEKVNRWLNCDTTDDVREASREIAERREAERLAHFKATYVPPPPGGLVVRADGTVEPRRLAPDLTPTRYGAGAVPPEAGTRIHSARN
ncbi:hypothetical protein [Sorangium sp. So ce693]|uniref:hypothetical protein n=1 Tax=Sorangium sp. So ce693 TaxID=3133318 RepID=UPI003F604B10